MSLLVYTLIKIVATSFRSRDGVERTRDALSEIVRYDLYQII